MDFNGFKDAVYHNFNMDLRGYKENQLKRRIDSLMLSLGVKSYDEYLNLLLKKEDYKTKFFDKITINVSEFFRNPEIFSYLENTVLPDLLKKFNKLKVWSAACSVGAEPYSLAMILSELIDKTKFTIDGTDLDKIILQKAKEGVYNSLYTKNISAQRLNKYFDISKDNYILHDNIKRLVNFKHHDLILDNYPTGYNLIICRNVTIYFTRETQDKIYHNFYNSLVPGGVLFIGATESIFNYREIGLERISPWFYFKKGE